MQAFGRRFFIASTLLYVATFLLWRALVRSPLYDAWWQLQVSEIFGMVSYLPAALLLPGAIALRSRWALLGLTIPFIWFGVEYGALFLPNATSRLVDGEIDTLRVMTWNGATTVAFDAGYIPDLKTAAAKVQPDVILLQEVGPNLVQQLHDLAEGWPYQTDGIAGGRASLAIASKWQIVDVELDEEWEGCHCLRVTLDWKGRLIDVVNVHVIVPDHNIGTWRGLPVVRVFDASKQTMIFDALVADFAHTEQLLIIAGDFNTSERQPNYARMLDAGYRNAHVESGWGFGLTFPRPASIIRWSLLPLLRIDHVFYEERWVAQQVWTGMIRSSDHLYVVADLQVRESR